MIKWIREIEHRFNPLHTYCRLVEAGYCNNKSRKVCKWYERTLYFYLCRITKILNNIYRRKQ